METKFSAPAQTGPGAFPASCKIGTVFFPRVKSGRGRCVNHPPPFSAEVKERVELVFLSVTEPLWRVVGRTIYRFILN